MSMESFSGRTSIKRLNCQMLLQCHSRIHWRQCIWILWRTSIIKMSSTGLDEDMVLQRWKATSYSDFQRLANVTKHLTNMHMSTVRHCHWPGQSWGFLWLSLMIGREDLLFLNRGCGQGSFISRVRLQITTGPYRTKHGQAILTDFIEDSTHI